MYRRIANTAIVVKDYDEAINFYVNTLDFVLIEDSKLSEDKRWVIVAPKGAKESGLLLAKASNEQQVAAIGNQTGGRVFMFMFTDDFDRDYKMLKDRNVIFVRQPEVMEYGKVAVFEDLYGNRWDLIQPNEHNTWFNAQSV